MIIVLVDLLYTFTGLGADRQGFGGDLLYALNAGEVLRAALLARQGTPICASRSSVSTAGTSLRRVLRCLRAPLELVHNIGHAHRGRWRVLPHKA